MVFLQTDLPPDAVDRRCRATLAQVLFFPSVERCLQTIGCFQGGRFRSAIAAKLVEQRELVKVLSGLRQKFVAEHV